MLNGLENIGCINGMVTMVFATGSDTYTTIFQDGEGRLRLILIDDGLEIREYEYANPTSKVRKQRLSGVLSSGFKS